MRAGVLCGCHLEPACLTAVTRDGLDGLARCTLDMRKLPRLGFGFWGLDSRLRKGLGLGVNLEICLGLGVLIV